MLITIFLFSFTAGFVGISALFIFHMIATDIRSHREHRATRYVSNR